MRALRATIGIVALAALMLATAGAASAKDRNNDRIPDRWEKRHDLSLKVNQARRDQDRDGLRNRAEFRAKTDPRDADSDDDGTEDSDEGAGTITSYDTDTGELVINLFGGDSVTGLVTDETRIRCGCKGTDGDYGPEDDEAEDAETLRHPGGDETDGAGEDSSGPGGPRGDGPRGGQGGGGHHDDSRCSVDDLVAGAAVSEARLRATADGLVFEEIELVGKSDAEDDDAEDDGDEG